MKIILDPNHPDIGASMNNLGITLHSLNKLDEAYKIHRETLAFRKRILDPNHPSIGTSMNNLA